jgi:aminoglycoside phosphotransferase (APT) family kinase protein
MTSAERNKPPKMHEGEADTDSALVRRLLASQFPHWADLEIERFPSGGTVNAIYRIGEDMCVRLPLVEAWAWHLETEAKWLPKLAPHLPVAVPEVLGHGIADEGYPFDWSVYGWLEGEEWRTDGVHDEREAAADLANFISALWKIDTTDGQRPRRASRIPLPAFDQWVQESTEKARDMIDADALLAAWELSRDAPGFDGTPVWTHSDLGPGNVLVFNGRMSAVIDWGSVHVGDPARDISVAWSMLSREGRKVLRDELDVDDATWVRARGWAVRAVGALDYYRNTNRSMVEDALHSIGEVLADLERGD